jgi:hypothetical protein
VVKYVSKKNKQDRRMIQGIRMPQENSTIEMCIHYCSGQCFKSNVYERCPYQKWQSLKICPDGKSVEAKEQ